MQIFVKLYSGKTITLEVLPSDLVSSLRNLVKTHSELPLEIQRLVYSGHQLEDNRTLSDYDIKSEQTIFESYRRPRRFCVF